MKKNHFGIGTRLYLSFFAVILLFVCVCGYQVYSMGRLAELQDEGAQRANDSVAILKVSERVADSYSVIGDAMINRNMTDTMANFQKLKSQAKIDVKNITELLDTPEELTLASDFDKQYMQYLATFENEMLPILLKEESMVQRANDSLAIAKVTNHLESVYTIMADGIINREPDETRRNMAAFSSTARTDMETVKNLADTDQEKSWANRFAGAYRDYLGLYRNQMLPLLEHDPVDDKRLKQLDGQLDKLRNVAIESLASIQELLNLERTEIEADEQKLRELDGAVDELKAATMRPLNKIVESLNEENLEADSHFDAIGKQAKSTSIVISVLGALLGFAISFLITRSLMKQLGAEPTEVADIAERIALGDLDIVLENKAVESGVFVAMKKMVASLREKTGLATTIASGDLSRDVTLASENDALGKALQGMSSSLNGLLNQVQASSEQISAGGSQIASSSETLSQGASEQASSLEEISASINEMASQTTINAKNAGQASTLASQAQQAAHKGSNQMHSMVGAMNEINEAGQNISKIIKTIDEIAFQTNLLALNAAVEAARAGQHGKGFAVVAEEVRNLAARSAKAAAETAELIESSVAKTENGSSIANQTAEALEEIVAGITQVTDLVGEIAAANNEQAQGISQVNQGLTQIDSVTQQNTASAEECAASAEELSGQAEQLRQMLQGFTLKGGIQRERQPGPTSTADIGWKDLGSSVDSLPAPLETSHDDVNFVES
jgi:methyl-accepting chemotaxis protein